MVSEPIQNQRSITNTLVLDDDLTTWAEAFVVDRRARNLAPSSLNFYRIKLKSFLAYCDAQVVTRIGQLTADFLRRYLIYLADTGHNPQGVLGFYATVKAFLRWWEAETEPEGWKNPIKRVKPPKINQELLNPVSLDDVLSLIAACGKDKFGARDKALLLCLLDTGARAREFCAIDRADVDLITGSVLIRQGKGGKGRIVFLGQKSRRALRAYLKRRTDEHPALWVNRYGGRLAYSGLRQVIRRRAKDAGIKVPSLHSFRRAFALGMLRAGVDVYSLQALMGHADLQVLKRYLKQTIDDLQEAHAKGSPVDKGLGHER